MIEEPLMHSGYLCVVKVGYEWVVAREGDLLVDPLFSPTPDQFKARGLYVSESKRNAENWARARLTEDPRYCGIDIGREYEIGYKPTLRECANSASTLIAREDL